MISLGYIVFLAVITLLYYILPARFQRPLLLVASLAFIGSLSMPFLLFAVVFSAINYLFGIWMNALKTPRRRKFLYFTSLFVNIGALIFFKYSNFFLENINFLLRSFAARETVPLLSVLLPLGISYYTFQCTQPTFRQVPPSSSFSTIPTLKPS